MAIIDPQDELNLQEEQPKKEPDNTSSLPEKYRGKSVEEIVKMHQEAEALIGRQAQEVGEVRKLADDLIKRQFNTQTPQEPAKESEVEDVDFFVDPKQAVNRVLENNPILKEIKESVANSKAEAVKAKLVQKHPDVEAIVKDPQFFEWVKGNRVRIALFQAADQGLDLDAADELFSNYKLHKQIKEKTVSEGVDGLKEENKRALKAAVVPSGDSTGETSKKIYRRADLIRLQIEDPERYMSLQPEIMAAYSEGRVK